MLQQEILRASSATVNRKCIFLKLREIMCKLDIGTTDKYCGFSLCIVLLSFHSEHEDLQFHFILEKLSARFL